MSKVKDLHQEWTKDPQYHEAFQELALEFELAHAVIEAQFGVTKSNVKNRTLSAEKVVRRLST